MRGGVVRREDGTVLASRCDYAVSLYERMRGLLGRSCLEPDEAMLIARCGAVHTIGMRFPLDLFFVDRQERIVSVVRNVHSGRFFVFGGVKAARVYEVAAGVWPTTLQVGEFLRFDERKD